MTIPTGPILADLLMVVSQLSKQVEHLSAREKPRPKPRPDSGQSDIALVRHVLAERRSREGHLPAALLGEPAWDILLDLYLAEAEGRTSYSTSCCVAAAAPQSTALRYIKRLAAFRLIEETADRYDSRRTLIALTDQGRAALSGWLDQWRRSRWFAGQVAEM